MPRFDESAWRQQCQALRGLAFCESQRAQFNAEDALFGALDRDDLRRFGERVIADLRTRKRRGALGFESMYGGTLTHLTASECTDLLRRFSESSWFASYGEVGDRTAQICFEEATYRFLCEQDVGNEEVRRVEFLQAITRALAVQPHCAFSVPEEVQRAPFGCFALAPLAGKTLLFALVEGRLVTGPVSPASAAFMTARGCRPAISEVAQEDWRTVGRALAASGIGF